MNSKFFIVAVFLTASGFSAAAATGWINKPAWNDRPEYAENFDISYTPTNLIEEKEVRKVCVDFNQSTYDCDQYENKTVAVGSKAVFDVKSNSKHEYLGNGYIRSNLSISSNQLTIETLKETTLLLSESEYINWFNQRYYYNGTNITSAELDSLQDKLTSLSASSGETRIIDIRINNFEIVSLSPFKVSADATVVFKLEEYRTGTFTLSDLIQVKVESEIAN